MGLHFADVERLLEVLHRLSDGGNTVVVIEHNLDVIKTADWIVDLGPEGGELGGEVVAEGTPEEIAQTPASYTGQFLRPVLRRHAAGGGDTQARRGVRLAPAGDGRPAAALSPSGVPGGNGPRGRAAAGRRGRPR